MPELFKKSEIGLNDTTFKMVIDLIPSEFIFKRCQVAVFSDKEVFYSGHSCKIFKIFLIDSTAESGMMCSTC